MTRLHRSTPEVLVSTWLPVATAAAAGLWAVFIFSDNQRDIAARDRDQRDKDNVARLIEARKPLFERQLSLYTQVTQIAGKIIITDPSSADYNSLVQDFTRLMVSDAAFLADQKVAQAMADFRLFALKKRRGDDPRSGFPKSFALGQAMRAATQASWLNGLGDGGTLLPPLPLPPELNDNAKPAKGKGSLLETP